MMPKIAIPTAPDELEEFLSDPGKVKALMAENQFGEFIQAYATTVMDKDKELKAQVREQVQMAMADFMEKNGQDVRKGVNLVDMRNKVGAAPSTALDNPRANGAPLNGLFPDFYSFLQAAWHKGNPKDDIAQKLATIRDYSEKVPAEGGLLVPEEFRSQLMRLAMENAVVRPRATVIPMGAPRLHIPSVDETSRVSSVFGGVVVYRTEEGAELTESAATFASVKLDVTKQTALAHVPNELIRDWGAFGAFMDQTLPAAVGFYEDLDFISGNGAGQPLGALHPANEALITIDKETSQAASTIKWENVIKMYARMLPSSINNAVWLASPDTFAQLATMALTVGTGGSAVWITNAVGAPQLTLLGRPVIMTEKAPAALGTQGDLSFVDFSMYLIGDYQTMTVDSSEHVKFTSDKTTYRVIARNDGRPWLNSPLTPHNGSATLSPFVQLATRS
jgi:HK97 family phage major capsid protein